MKTRLLLLLIGLLLSSALHAGGFSFAWRENQGGGSNPNVITHPIGYDGSANQTLTINICIHSDVSAQMAADMETPIRNALARFNALEPELNNTVTGGGSDVPGSQIDFESVFMHEMGHCMGLAHPNLASEARDVDGSLTEQELRFGKALQGTNGNYDLDAGSDGVIGTFDDVRCDDENVNWFRMSDNDPFAYGNVFDTTTYSVDAGEPDNCDDFGDLPSGDTFVEIAGLQVGPGDAEAVMVQGTRFGEAQRNLNFDDAAMLRLAMSGADRDQDTSDDYTYELVLQEQQGTQDDAYCDVTVNMTGSNLGVCRVKAFAEHPVTDHFTLAVDRDATDGDGLFPRIEFDPSVDWYFNDTLSAGVVFEDRFEEN